MIQHCEGCCERSTCLCSSDSLCLSVTHSLDGKQAQFTAQAKKKNVLFFSAFVFDSCFSLISRNYLDDYRASQVSCSFFLLLFNVYRCVQCVVCSCVHRHAYMDMSTCTTVSVHACVYGDLKLMWAIFSIDLLSDSLSSPGSLNQTQVINFACQLAPEICFTE